MNHESLQGGLTNEELRDAWANKLPGVEPTDRELTAFALGVEVGDVSRRTYFLERNSARDAWRRRMKRCEELEALLRDIRTGLREIGGHEPDAERIAELYVGAIDEALARGIGAREGQDAQRLGAKPAEPGPKDAPNPDPRGETNV
jgi:hypothetical protein